MNLADGASVEVVLRHPLQRAQRSETYAVNGIYRGVVDERGERFVAIFGDGGDFMFIPIAMVGAILANGERTAAR